MTRGSSVSRNVEEAKEREIDVAVSRHLSMPGASSAYSVLDDKWPARNGEGGRRIFRDVQFFFFSFFRHRLAALHRIVISNFFDATNGTERLNFFASFSGMKGRKKKE